MPVREVYISSACVKANRISDAIKEIVHQGFKNIELSGGTRPYPSLVDDLLQLKGEYGLNYLLHNYFPPPEKDFVLNLASLDDEIHRMSIDHVRKALELSKLLGAKKYGVHAGFLINIPVSQIGKKIDRLELFDREEALDRFVKTVAKLQEDYPSIRIYLENNVLSEANFQSFGCDPFFLTSSKGWDEIDQRLDVGLICDVAHLYVTCKTLRLNMKNELSNMVRSSDYIHISGNNGKTDSNEGLSPGSELTDLLGAQNWSNSTVTLEIYSGWDDIYKSIEILNNG